MSFLDSDGYINVAEFILLARDIDRMAAKEGLKPAELYFSKKAIVKSDHPSKKKLDEAAFTKKRAQPIKLKSRMPASGSRVRMMVLLRNYKGLEQEGYEDYYKDYVQAVKAIERHNAKADKVVDRLKVDAAKKRDHMNAEFDKNLDCFTNEVLPEDIEFIVGKSMMGKTVIVKLPNGGFVSIGKSDKERFLAAKKSAAEAPAKPVGRVGRAGRVAKPAAKPVGRGRPVAKATRKTVR